MLLFHLNSFSQEEQYFTLQLEVDARNALVGGTVNERGYNIVLKGGFSAQWFRVDGFFEFFEELRYKTAGINFTHLIHYRRRFKQGLGIQISLIEKPKKVTPSLGVNGILEYHLDPFFVSLRGETKMRTDWDITVFSGFVGLGYKL
ncbi:hypothetical protein BH23BAC2_BH23BAC2_17770 [soil metagenome]